MARRQEPEPADLLTIADAAKLLGVSVQTLRRWDESGKFPARRHPMDSYRIYTRKEVLGLRKKIVRSGWAA